MNAPLHDHDKVASIVLEQYRILPAKGKPLVRSNGVKEWTVLAGVVVERGGQWECTALATGLKAMPEKVISGCGGTILHDMHAEVLALRGFNRWLLAQAASLRAPAENWWVERSSKSGKFKARENMRVFLYVSAPPCGDASMSLFAGETWASRPEGLLIRGRNHFDCLGYIRTKPGRQDSELAMSKSCSDKLALKQQTGIVLGPVLHVYEPLYLTELVCPVLPDFERAFRRWPAVHYFQWHTPQIEFVDGQDESKTPSPTSLVWVKSGVHESIVNGVRQGSKPGSGKGVSALSRREIAETVRTLVGSDSETNYVAWKTRPKLYPAGWQQTASDDFIV